MTFAVTTRVGLLLIAGLPMIRCAQTSPRPLLCLAITVACVGVSAGWVRHAFRRRAPPDLRRRFADAAVTGTALATSALWVPVEQLHSSWVGWPEFLALNVCAVAAGSVGRLRHAVLIGVGWAGLWTAAIPPFATNQTWQDLAGTALNFVMFAALLQVVATFVGRIAVVADEARRQARRRRRGGGAAPGSGLGARQRQHVDAARRPGHPGGDCSSRAGPGVRDGATDAALPHG